jgi:integrase/recombinase XerD
VRAKSPSSPSPSPSRSPSRSPSAPADPSEAPRKPLLSLTDAIGRYLATLLAEGRSKSTAEVYGRHLLGLAAFLASLPAPPVTPADVTADHVAAFRDHEIARERKARGKGPLSALSVHRAVTVMRGFFRHLSRRGAILLDPTLDLSAPRLPFRLPRNVPTARQMRRLLSSPDTKTGIGKRDRAILELLYGAGLRNAELCGLLIGDVSLSARTVFVRKGKGAKDRVVPLGKSAARAVSEYLGAYETLSHGKAPAKGLPLFYAASGRQIRGHVLLDIVKKHLRRSGLSSLEATPHSLRHACATHLLTGGADIRQIQVLLGHASIATTQVYTKVETTDLRRMLDRHHPRSWEEDERSREGRT